MPAGTTPEKIAAIEHYGGRCALVDDPTHGRRRRAGEIAAELDGHFMDQFTYRRAGDGLARQQQHRRGDLRPAASASPGRCRHGSSCGAGTGGTSATIGRYLRYRRLPTRLCVVDPEHSVFFDGYRSDRRDAVRRAARASRGSAGRASRLRSCRDRRSDDQGAGRDQPGRACGQLERLLGRRCGGSTGTNLVGVLALAAEMHASGRARQHRHPDLRWRRAVSRHLL